MTIFAKCDEIAASGRSAALVTIVHTSSGTPGKQGFKLVLAEDGELFGTVGGGALEHQAIEDGRKVLSSRSSTVLHYDLSSLGMECGGEADLVIEYLQAVRPFVLFGGGHVGRAVAPLLQSIGFSVMVYDPRPEAAEYFQSREIPVISAGYNELSSAAESLAGCAYCLIATHGHQNDYAVLKHLLSGEDSFRYIGLIGSIRKVKTTVDRLQDDGVQAPEYLYAPVGTKIGAQTAEEIAVSVAAEVVAVKNGFQADHMKIL